MGQKIAKIVEITLKTAFKKCNIYKNLREMSNITSFPEGALNIGMGSRMSIEFMRLFSQMEEGLKQK